MKTPKELVASMPKCFDHCATHTVIDLSESTMESLIADIQKEAYDLGRADGLEESVSDFKKISATDPTDTTKD